MAYIHRNAIIILTNFLLYAPQESSTQSQAPYKKKKVAMMLSYCGQGYSGMQRNPGMLTIESVLLDALVKAGVVRQEHADFPGEKVVVQHQFPAPFS